MADDPLPSSGFSRLRRWGIGLNVLISCAAVLAIVGMLNYLASRHFVRYRWTAGAGAPPSPQTLSVLNALTNEVKVIVLFEPDAPGTLYADVKDLLREYQLACPHLQVQFVDYLRDSGGAALVKAQYRLNATTDADLVIFDCGGRYRVVSARELSDYDMNDALRGQPIRRTTFKGDQLFSSALLSVTDPKPLHAYTLTGHGEHDLTNEDATRGYQKFADLLREKNITVEPLNLRTNEVPDDCSVLLIAGPRTRIPSEELEKIDAYLKKGGRALMLLLNTLLTGGRRSGLERLLAEWNVDVGDNLVVDRAQGRADAARVLITSEFGGHPVVNPIRDARLALVMPRSVRQRVVDARGTDAVKVNELVFTSPSGAALANVGGPQGVVETNGTIPLIVAVERGVVTGVSPDWGATRLVVAGESVFLANEVIDTEANRDFASLAVNWLLGRGLLLNIGPRPIQSYQVSLTVAQRRQLRWILLGALPGSVLFLGCLVWVRRRK
jgi:hypothetical protein